MKKSSIYWLSYFGVLVATAITAYFYSDRYLEKDAVPFILCMTAFFIEGGALFALLAVAKGGSILKTVLSTLVGCVAFPGGALALAVFFNVVLYRKNGIPAAPVIASVSLIFLLVLLGAFYLKKATSVKWAQPVVGILLSVSLLAVGLLPLLHPSEAIYLSKKHVEANPTGFATYTKEVLPKADNAEVYVATNGSDENDGSFNRPVATIERARDIVRAMDKTGKSSVTVAFKAGEYRVNHIDFTEEDSGTESCPIIYRAYGDGEVVFNGGKTLDPSVFSPVTDPSVLARFTAEAAKNVVCADLTALGLTAEDWGKLYPVGKYGTADHYDGDTTGPTPCALFFNGAPLTTARYPNEGFLTVKSVIREGTGKESSTSNHAQRSDWATLRNPETTVFTIDDETAERLHNYSSLNNVWLWTALMYNWADTTVPLKTFDYQAKTVEPAYVSVYGAQPGTTYYIFNVLEELDAPGEWYLDRDSGMLYFYQPEKTENADIVISLSTEDMISVTGAEFLRFEGLSIRGTRGSGIVIRSNDVRVDNCFISDLSGAGVLIDGYRNHVSDCELAHIGGSAVDVTGGDRVTLTPGENYVENCLIHDYSEVSLTEGPGVNIYGVGNVCTHNEFYNSPQQAIIYGGNNTLIEYNLMHEIALLSDDCSAIYSGRRCDWGGCVLRYNVMYNIGDKDHAPNGIYWDDGLSGQTAYGNVVINCKGNGFLIGGGRNNIAYNNLLINCFTSFSYDDRARDGVMKEDSWFKHSKEGEDIQQNLMASPWQTELWQKTYPYMTNWSLDYSDTENPNFVPNPAGSRIYANIVVHYADSLGKFDDAVCRFSDRSGNAVYGLNATKRLFIDPENGDYRLRDSASVHQKINFPAIPYKKIGRMN